MAAGKSELLTEIVDQIVDHLDDDPHTLKACSLISRQWTSRTRYHLFYRSTMTLRGPMRGNQLLNLVHTPHTTIDLARVRRLSLWGDLPDGHLASFLTGLKNLEIAQTFILRERLASPWMNAFSPNLSHLSFFCVNLENPQTLSSILSSCGSRLRSVTLLKIWWTNASMDSHHNHPVPLSSALESLYIDATSLQFLEAHAVTQGHDSPIRTLDIRRCFDVWGFMSQRAVVANRIFTRMGRSLKTLVAELPQDSTPLILSDLTNLTHLCLLMYEPDLDVLKQTLLSNPLNTLEELHLAFFNTPVECQVSHNGSEQGGKWNWDRFRFQLDGPLFSSLRKAQFYGREEWRLNADGSRRFEGSKYHVEFRPFAGWSRLGQPATH